MGLFRDFTPEERARLSEKKAQVDSLFLANDFMIILERTQQEFKVSQISETESFKKLILSNVTFAWENDLTYEDKRYYYQNLGILLTTPKEQKEYFDRLICLAANDIVKRFSDYIQVHEDIEKVVVRY